MHAPWAAEVANSAWTDDSDPVIAKPGAEISRLPGPREIGLRAQFSSEARAIRVPRARNREPRALAC
jgi:hypothetical protein